MDLGALVESANACRRALNEFFKSFTIPTVTWNFSETLPIACLVMNPARLAPGRARVLIPKDELARGARLGARDTDATGPCFCMEQMVVQDMDLLKDIQSMTLDEAIREVRRQIESSGIVPG